MMVIVRLVAAQARRHAWRGLLTVAAIAIATVVVGFSVRQAQVTRQQVYEATHQFGRFDVVVSPKDFGATQLDPGLVARLREDPAVSDMDAAVKSRIRVLRPDQVPGYDPLRGAAPTGRGSTGASGGGRGGPGGAPGGGGRGGQGMGPFGGSSAIGTDATVPPQALADGRWLVPGSSERQAVITTAFQERYGLKLGDAVTIAGNGEELTLTVIGTIRVKGMIPGVRMMPAPHVADVFLTQAMAAELNGFSGRPSMVGIVLRDPDQAGAFARAWRDRATAADPPAALRSTQDQMDDPMGGPPSGMQSMLFATTSLGAILFTGFIAFLSLAVGVRARLRQYAILRALALARWQLAVMVLLESLGLAGAGLAAGLLGLWLMTIDPQGLSAWVPAVLSTMVRNLAITPMLIAICTCSALLGAIAAAILPIWQVTRIRPLDILGGQGGSRSRFPWRLTVIGLLCILVNPVIILLGSHESVRFIFEAVQSACAAVFGRSMGFGVPIVGSLLMILGLVMITPSALWLVERLLHRPMAGALALDGRLLRQQLSGNLWSAVGTTVALSIGLTIYVAALVWGFSMLVPFTPTNALPRLQIAILPAGLPDTALPEFLAVEGIQPARCLPIASEQPRLSAATLARPGFAHVNEQQRHVLVMGVDPQRAFGGPDPLFHLDFLEGDAASAATALAGGRGCVVPDHFATQCGLKLGDEFSVEVPEQPDRDVTYRIVGIASIPGWNWLTKFSEIRRRAGRALAIVFTGYAQARQDYGLERISFFWLDPAGDPTDPALVANLAQRIEPIGKKHSKVNLNVPRAGRTEVGTQYVTITDREDIKVRIAKRAGDVIDGFKGMPLVTLAISSLALFNTIFASIRSRFWQFGILRGIGMTRGQLVRLIVGESLLICLTSCILSLGAGIALAWCGTRLSALFFFFAGRTPPLAMPPLADAIGWGVLLAIIPALLACIIPALLAGYREPLRYIQGGRMSA